jgi:hypothetical protein
LHACRSTLEDPHTIPHRLIFKEEYSSQGLAIVKEILENIPLPL